MQARRAEELKILGVTLDPEFDTPEVLKKYAEQYGADLSSWTMVTGSEELVADAIPSLFSVLSMPSSTVVMTHTVKVALLRPGLLDYREWSNNEF